MFYSFSKFNDLISNLGDCRMDHKTLVLAKDRGLCIEIFNSFKKTYDTDGYYDYSIEVDRWRIRSPIEETPLGIHILPVEGNEFNIPDPEAFDAVLFYKVDYDFFGKKQAVSCKPHRRLPPLARTLCFDCEGWVVGSTADYIANKDSSLNGRDLDIVIPSHHWNKASHICINADKISINSFGGFKCVSDGVEIDVWMDDVSDLLANHHTDKAYHPRSRTYIKREKL